MTVDVGAAWDEAQKYVVVALLAWVLRRGYSLARRVRELLDDGASAKAMDDRLAQLEARLTQLGARLNRLEGSDTGGEPPKSVGQDSEGT